MLSLSARLLASILLLVWVSTARAALRFDKEEITLSAGLNQEETHADFKFKNTGEHPITIKSIKPPCGCTTADADKKVYLPGESGIISATIKIGTAQGKLIKYIDIETTDAEHSRNRLTVHIDIPQLVSFSPNQYVRWDQGADAKPQIVKLKVEASFPIKITGVKSFHDKVQAHLREITPGREYEIIVTPRDTSSLLNNAIEIQNDVKPAKRIWLLVHIKRKGEM